MSADGLSLEVTRVTIVTTILRQDYTNMSWAKVAHEATFPLCVMCKICVCACRSKSLELVFRAVAPAAHSTLDFRGCPVHRASSLGVTPQA